MFLPERIVLVLRRRRERARLAAREVARERAVTQRLVERRAHGTRDETQVVPTQGDLICFKVAVRPC